MSRRNKHKRSKEKIVKLTDEQYNAYIMALKDERPPALVRKMQEENQE